jgi:hypothetical protein
MTFEWLGYGLCHQSLVRRNQSADNSAPTPLKHQTNNRLQLSRAAQPVAVGWGGVDWLGRSMMYAQLPCQAGRPAKQLQPCTRELRAGLHGVPDRAAIFLSASMADASIHRSAILTYLR